MEHLVNNPVFPDPDPVQRFRAGKFLYVVGKWICGQIFKVFENKRK
jgi:K+/H+ antiporter YhaU regulatory subunit KhtT